MSAKRDHVRLSGMRGGYGRGVLADGEWAVVNDYNRVSVGVGQGCCCRHGP